MAGFTAAASTSSLAHSQNPCPEPTVVRAWVDSYYGHDGTAMVGDPNLPFGTIQAGIDALAFDPAVSQGIAEGLLHVMPGIYSSDASQSLLVPMSPSANQNVETFPIRMRNRVSIQGTGAKECVVQVRTGEGVTGVPWPDAAFGCEGQLPGRLASVAFNFSFLGDATDEMLDGITIQGADVQVLAWAESNIEARISNCVFDMRDQGEETNLNGSVFGVHTVAIWDLSIRGYPRIDLSLFNNTFLQAWRTGPEPEQVQLAPADAVAVCNVNDPDPVGSGEFPEADRDLLWRGVNDLHIQNNLIRTTTPDAEPGITHTAFLGIDFGDTAVLRMSGAVLPTNAFATLNVGGANIPGTLCSAIVGVPPVPAVDSSVQDPAFFGEMNTDRRGVFTFDARLLPSSPMADAGQAPEPTDDDCTAVLTAANGRVHVEQVNPTPQIRTPLASFDLDGEGHGNARVAGESVDIGFDETAELLIGGSYGENTKSHNQPWDPILPFQVPTGNVDRIMVFPTAAPFAYHINRTPMPFGGLLLQPAWTVMPGSLDVPAPFLFGTVSWVAFGPNYLNVGSFTPAAITWTNWVDGSLHPFGEFVFPFDEVPSGSNAGYFSNQTFRFAGPTLIESNLQAEYL